MVHQPVICKGSLDITYTACSRKDGMVQNRPFDDVGEVHATARHRRLQVRRQNRGDVRVEVLVERRAVAEHLAERGDGLVWTCDDAQDVFALGEGRRPGRVRDVLARELLLLRQDVAGEAQGAWLAGTESEMK